MAPKLPDFSAMLMSASTAAAWPEHQGTPGSICSPMAICSNPSACTTAPEVSPPATMSWRTPSSTRPRAMRAISASISAPARSAPSAPCVCRTLSGAAVE